MKKIIQSIGLMSLICFSFMYTDKVMEVISEKDSLMVEIEEKKDDYNIEVIEAVIDLDTIIPGIEGKEVDVQSTYNNMRELGIFREDLLVYYTTYPKVKLDNNYDKFIISGNQAKQEVSLVFRILDDTGVDKLFDIISRYEVNINLFVDSDYLSDNISKLGKLDNIEVYSYGKKGVYSHDNLVTSNNIIRNKTGVNKGYCLANDREEDTIKVCSKDKYNTIYPTIKGDSNPYNSIKNNLKNGAIISLDINSKTLSELPSVIEFIKGKGLNISYLSSLLTEDRL